ncbi:type VI secretion system contractile sheath large subunit, partial [Halocynthiibacter namhaensis]|uniref:type VI secretion system contractile sheath large subunit n=1 Tax=Halocynthiibacter namhaensis TaxID=1290553 RepID=UPI00057942E9
MNTQVKNEPEQAEAASGSLLDQIMAKSNLAPQDDGYDVARKGVGAFIAELLDNQDQEEPINKARVDRMIAEVDRKISGQMDAILHHPEFQEIESTWRGLKLLIDRTDFRENIKVELMSIRKDELLEDFELSPEVSQSGLYKHIYSAEYGQFGGEPVGAMIGMYEFNSATPDMKLLQYCASVGAMSHAPFISSVAPEFFGIDSFTELPNIKEVASIFESPKYTKWRSLRESEDARYVGLTAPRFLLRNPYDPLENPIKTFQYREEVEHSHDAYLWGNSALLMAERINDSFAKYRWCPNIIGPQSGGAVEDLPVHVYEAFGQLEQKIPTEVLVTDRREFELAEEGFITLTMRKGSDNAAF